MSDEDVKPDPQQPAPEAPAEVKKSEAQPAEDKPAEPVKEDKPAEPVKEDPKPEPPEHSAQAPSAKNGEVKKKEKVEMVTQYHPCTWCGGRKKFVPKTKHVNSVVVGMRLLSNENKELLVCHPCVYKVFNSILGQALFRGQEMMHLTQEKQHSGFFPERAF